MANLAPVGLCKCYYYISYNYPDTSMPERPRVLQRLFDRNHDLDLELVGGAFAECYKHMEPWIPKQKVYVASIPN